MRVLPSNAMQAVIMAAGRSTRTHPLTATRPKPLVPIWDRPLLEHQLRQLDGLVAEVLLVVGFLREQIEGRFGDAFGEIRLRYVVQEHPRGTADALLAARPHVNARCLVLNGDDFYHRDDLAGLLASGRGLLIAQAKDPENRAVVQLQGDVLRGIVEKPKNPTKDAWCSVGGYCVERDDLRHLDEVVPSLRGEHELPDFILRLVEQSVVRAKRIERFWLPITYSWDVLQAALFLWEDPARARELGLVDETPSAIRARSDVTLGRDVRIQGPVRLGANVRIADGARLFGPIAIGSGARIAEDAVVKRSILFDDVVVGARARVLDSVLGERVSVGAAARIESRPGAELAIEVKGKRVVPEIARLGVVAGDGVSIDASAVVPAGTLI
jgi:bifunctional UDP-N-acetylglucosamine pyrophosphorylase/glucosamine-1-phosphate N-acetyltransferase